MSVHTYLNNFLNIYLNVYQHINYKFHLEPFTLDGNNTDKGFANVSNTPDFVFTHNFNDGYGTYENTTYPNFASPFLSGLMRGYKRGETYR